MKKKIFFLVLFLSLLSEFSLLWYLGMIFKIHPFMGLFSFLLVNVLIRTQYEFTVEDMCRRYPNATAVSISGSAIYLLVMKAICSLR